MGLFRKVVSVRPNQVGYLYRNNKFLKRLTPGIYKFFDFLREFDAVIIPTISKLITVTNQEVLTKDNISLRLSYILEYQITDGNIFISRFNLFESHQNYCYTNLITEAESVVHNLSQVYLREEIASIESQELNKRKKEILNHIPESLQIKLNSYGISVHQLIIKDIYFPKIIQQLFAQQLEAKIRSKLDLENARTTVATARALKNAAELMKNNENIKFIQFLETISKIATQGKHTFIVGDIQNQNLSKD
ncbi:slipin family protein [Pleurocapsa sp. PCC 7319]|uniref:slipin family protein n=1 Tax=Pleurocapsa sp. PCC 7319 TaxID=118161 RepID=UPI000344FDD2|nr:slipin family protein [Pleurocapsa sp. PCC 7319]